MHLKNIKRHEEVYEKISSFYAVKFKAQLKDSPIEFRGFYFIRDLVNDNEIFTIEFANNESIEFTDKNNFVEEFIKYLKIKIKELEDEFELLNSYEFNGMKYDENELFMQHEYIGHGTEKLNQILGKFNNAKKTI